MSSLTVTSNSYELYSSFTQDDMLHSTLNIHTKVTSHFSSNYLNEIKFLMCIRSALDEIEIDDLSEPMTETTISTNMNQL